MLITDNKVLRNLQEQVAKNKSDISDILEAKAVIAEFGIRVVGEVDTEAELPDPATYSGEYGDAYTVGIQTPYDYYIFTRPNDDIPTAHWFNVGQFPMPGPQGEPGLPGAKGEKGSMIYVEKNTNPTVVTGYNVGDLWINSKDNALFQLNNNGWDRVGYVKGDTGPQGPKGDKGDTGAPGTPLNIVGVLNSIDLLPNPATVNKVTAYLVGTSAPYMIYVIVGDINDTSTWTWQQLAVGGTNVTVNNQPVGTFNADSKLDKMTTTSNYNRAYIVKQDGSQTLLNCGSDAGPYTLISRTSDAQLIVPETPAAEKHATSKKYVDTGLNNKLDKVTTSSNFWRVYAVTADGQQAVHNFGPDAGPWTLVERDGNLQIVVPVTPLYDDNATSKKYVDQMTTGTTTVFVASSSISTGDKNGASFACQGGTKGVYAVNNSDFVGIMVVTSPSSGLMYGYVLSAINPGDSINGHKLI